MNHEKISGTTRKLLHNQSFIMWCMAPTEELEKKWGSWLEQYPEEQGAVDQARAILKSARLNDFSIPENKSELLWEHLQDSLQKKQAQKRWMSFRYAAACVAVLLLSATGYLLLNKNLFIENLLVGTNPSDNIQTEVTLILGTQETVEVEDNTLIDYQSEIKRVKAKETERVIAQKTPDNNWEETVMNTLVVPKGRRSSLLLEDGSKVWLNSGSSLRFPSHFASSHRSIEIKGEIYIEVAKSDIPFYVKTDKFTVNVLGTKFNIFAYEEDQERSVVLVEGSVKVEMTDDETITLSPDQKLTMLEGSNTIDQVDASDYISWKDGLLLLNGETMKNTLARISRCYNVPIRCQEDIENRRSSGKLVLFDDIHQVMETFSLLYNTRYHLESDTLLIEY